MLIGDVVYVTDSYTNDRGDEAVDFLLEIFEVSSRGIVHSNKVLCSMFGNFVKKYELQIGDTVQVLGKLRHTRVVDENDNYQDVVTVIPINIQHVTELREHTGEEYYHE